MKTIISTTLILIIFLFFAGPWIVAEKRKCTHKNIIKIGSVVAPILMLLPAASFSGWLFYIPTLLLYATAFICKHENS